ncbi:MAG: protein kinase [candidate division Zixibacteria bacterium]|nr:protein kinase [candidate division Zixibacteria bacterium]MCI0597132.1 protein kinase [candidate division Zixibacteria bacterium]
MTRVLIDGKYELIRKLKEGGFGIVYYGWDLTLDKPVAIKEIAPSLVGDQQYMDMFTDEAMNTAKLAHSNIIQVLDLRKTDEGRVFLIMEYIEGIDLRSALERCERDQVFFPRDLGVHIVAEVCKALDYAHQAKDRRTGHPLNIIHRDISPSNMMMSVSGDVKLIDFGIAKARQRVAKETRTGILKGKVNYMSPEQLEGKKIDGRSDLFSLGIALYEVLTTRQLFSGESDYSVMKNIVSARVETEPLIEKNVPVALQRIVLKALKKDPLERYQSAGEMYVDLYNYQRTSPLESPQAELSRFVNSLLLLRPEERLPKEDTTDTLRRIADKSKQIINTKEVQFHGVKDAEEVAVKDVVQAAAGADAAASAVEMPKAPPVKKPASAEAPTMLKATPPPRAMKKPPQAAGKKKGPLVPLGIAAGVLLVAAAAWFFLFAKKTVTLATVPSGAAVLINGEKQEGVTPLELKNLPEGEHDIVFRKAGLPDLMVHLSYPKKERKELTYAFEVPVQLVSVPSGAAVLINGAENGKTPFTVRWKLGEPFELKLRAADGGEISGFRLDPLRESADMTDSRLWRFSASKTPTLAFHVAGYFKREIEFRSNPSGASVFLGKDTAPVGNTAQNPKILLDYGKQKLRFTLSGHQPKEATLEVGAATEAVYAAELKPAGSSGVAAAPEKPATGGTTRSIAPPDKKPDTKTIDSRTRIVVKDERANSLSGAPVTIRSRRTREIVAQGKTDGNGTFSADLSGGTYRVTVAPPGFEPFSEEFAVVAGQGKTLACTLRRNSSSSR